MDALTITSQVRHHHTIAICPLTQTLPVLLRLWICSPPCTLPYWRCCQHWNRLEPICLAPNRSTENRCAVAASGPLSLEPGDSHHLTRALTVALVVYDSLITFDQEVNCFWSAKWTGAPLLFFANRWLTMTVYVTSLAQLASFSSDKVSRRLLVTFLRP